MALYAQWQIHVQVFFLILPPSLFSSLLSHINHLFSSSFFFPGLKRPKRESLPLDRRGEGGRIENGKRL